MGSTRWELSDAERLIFIDLLALVGLENPYKGYIEVYDIAQLGYKLKVSNEMLESTLTKLKGLKKIRYDKGKNPYKIHIVNWFRYNPQFKRKDKEEGKRVKDFIAKYCESFKALYGENPIISKKDVGIAKRLLKIPQIDLIMERFFKSKDKFILQNKHSLNIVESQINKLMVEKNGFMQIRSWLEERRQRDATK